MTMKVPLRVDFAGGWLDVPRHSISGGFIVNCAISPLVSLDKWDYKIESGLGGSGAHAILSGKDPIKSELDLGVGWQDPAVIMETGLCVWRSGYTPVLEAKVNPDFLNGKMALLWTGKNHNTPSMADQKRDYEKIYRASIKAKYGVLQKNIYILASSVYDSYKVQLNEGMKELPTYNELSKKYCGGGYGGYALYIVDDNSKLPDEFTKIEPYMELK